jgi:hypothetical protein
MGEARRLVSLDRELSIARDIQYSILPQAMPRVHGITVAARYRPMTSVAGDFYDFLELDEQRLGVLVADVSGHGVPAALIASMVKGVLRYAAAGHPPMLRVGKDGGVQEVEENGILLGFSRGCLLHDARTAPRARRPFALVHGRPGGGREQRWRVLRARARESEPWHRIHAFAGRGSDAGLHSMDSWSRLSAADDLTLVLVERAPELEPWKKVDTG